MGNVHVDRRQGWSRARMATTEWINRSAKVCPYDAVGRFGTAAFTEQSAIDGAGCHGYAARETDAAPVQVCGSNGKAAEQEKFLFYRGAGSFDLPLSAKLNSQQIELKNTSKDPISSLIVFENRDGKIGYRVVANFSGETTTERPALDKNIDSVIRDLKQTLISFGLYEKEAEAMIKTWRNSWFEEGLRVFYVLPRKTTDEVLPLAINPNPTQLVRVLVGRTELITPEMEKAVRKQVSLLSDT